MTQYFLTSEFLTADVELYVVGGDGGGSENSIIVYEAPGTNGGISINAGRMNKKRTLTGRILSKLKNTAVIKYTVEEIKQELSNIVSQLSEIKDRGIPVVLKAPITDNTTGTYFIKSFHWNVLEGNPYALTFTMELEEHRQSNVRKNIINIIGGEVVRALKEREQQLALD